MRVEGSTAPVIALAVLATASPAHAAGSLELIPNGLNLALSFAVLLLLIYPVNRLVLQPLVAVLEEREARTVGAIARAEALAAELAGQRTILEEGLAAARAEARARRTALLAEADVEDRRLIAAARADGKQELDALRVGVTEELESAREGLASDARALAREAASRILGREL